VTIEETLAVRGKSYGDFLEQASLSCSLKEMLHRTRGWQSLAPDQREALDMISVKIGRLLTGDPNHFDGWHDIEGYARLVASRLAK
jgi:hypothetical protein